MIEIFDTKNKVAVRITIGNTSLCEEVSIQDAYPMLNELLHAINNIRTSIDPIIIMKFNEIQFCPMCGRSEKDCERGVCPECGLCDNCCILFAERNYHLDKSENPDGE